MGIEAQSAELAEPRATAAPSTTEIHALDTTGSSRSVAIPAHWAKKFVTIQAVTLDTFLNFGSTSSVAASLTANSTISANAFSACDATASICIPAGTSRDFRIPDNCDGTNVFIAVIASGTSGKIRLFVSGR